VITSGKKKKAISMSDLENANDTFLSSCSEILPGRLYFNSQPISSNLDVRDDVHCFVTSDDIEYLSFFKVLFKLD